MNFHCNLPQELWKYRNFLRRLEYVKTSINDAIDKTEMNIEWYLISLLSVDDSFYWILILISHSWNFRMLELERYVHLLRSPISDLGSNWDSGDKIHESIGILGSKVHSSICHLSIYQRAVNHFIDAMSEYNRVKWLSHESVAGMGEVHSHSFLSKLTDSVGDRKGRERCSSISVHII